MTDIEKVREFFRDDRFAAGIGIRIEEASAGNAVCSLALRRDHMNAGGAVQGGVIFTLADFAFAVASNAEGRMTVSLTNNISYIHSPKGKMLTARAEKISAARRICVYSVVVTDDLGTLVAQMTVNGYIKDSVPNF